jgi:hypothetical protein
LDSLAQKDDPKTYPPKKSKDERRLEDPGYRQLQPVSVSGGRQRGVCRCRLDTLRNGVANKATVVVGCSFHHESCPMNGVRDSCPQWRLGRPSKANMLVDLVTSPLPPSLSTTAATYEIRRG